MNTGPASEIVGTALLAKPMDERVTFLRKTLAYAAAGLVSMVGEREALEAVYRVADAIPGTSR